MVDPDISHNYCGCSKGVCVVTFNQGHIYKVKVTVYTYP